MSGPHVLRDRILDDLDIASHEEEALSVFAEGQTLVIARVRQESLHCKLNFINRTCSAQCGTRAS